MIIIFAMHDFYKINNNDESNWIPHISICKFIIIIFLKIYQYIIIMIFILQNQKFIR